MPGDLIVLIASGIGLALLAGWGLIAPDNIGGGLALALAGGLGFLFGTWVIIAAVGRALG